VTGIVSALSAGAQGRCPNCGKGKLFKGYLKIADHCFACGEDFRSADSGDGPAFFVMSIVGAVVVPIAFILQMGVGLSIAATMAVAFALIGLLTFLLLPPTKGVLYAAQWANKAGEGRPET
jgi:uncharacterized protein (DUF983 family)